MHLSLNTETLEITIPYDLARFATYQRTLVRKYETNQVIKALDTWLVLKHLTSSGVIYQWNKQKDYVLLCCKCTDAIFRHRLQVLRDMKLVSMEKLIAKNDSIRLCSWDSLAERLEINIKKSLTIHYKIYDSNQKVYQWLIAAEIEYNKGCQDYKIARKLSVNAEAKMSYDSAIVKAGADRSKMNDLQYYLMWMRIVYQQDFNRLSEAHNELIEIRPDNNRSRNTISKHWRCKSPMTVVYWKKVLQQAGIIDVTRRRQVISQTRTRNPYCFVNWLKGPKQTILYECDNIEILKPWTIQGMLDLSKKAA